MTMTEFATALFLEKSSATRLADGLERKGYVTRKRRHDDARIHQLELTKRGGMLARKIEEDLSGGAGEGSSPASHPPSAMPRSEPYRPWRLPHQAKRAPSRSGKPPRGATG